MLDTYSQEIGNGLSTVPSKDIFDITQHANGPNSAQSQRRPNGSPWPPSQNEPRPSRESIIRNYNANAAEKARSTRRQSQQAIEQFQEREERTMERQRQKSEYENMAQESNMVIKNPVSTHMSQEQAKVRAREIRAQNRLRNTMTTQESHDRTISSKENFEAERARRDVFSNRNASRTSNREVIDGRGSIDSRAFNERNELVGYSIDKTDRPDPLIETPPEQVGKWNSQAGQGFAPSYRGSFSSRKSDLDKLSDSISGQSQYRHQGPFSSLPTSAKFLIVLIVILLAILIYLLFF